MPENEQGKIIVISYPIPIYYSENKKKNRIVMMVNIPKRLREMFEITKEDFFEPCTINDRLYLRFIKKKEIIKRVLF